MEDKKELVNDKHVMAAVVSLDTATTSENADKREHFKNNIIKFYGKVPEFKRAFDSAYVVKKKKFEDQGKTTEYGRLMEIGMILGLEKELTIEEKSTKEEKSISEKEKSNSVEDFSSCSEEFDKQFGCCNSDRCCLIA